MLGGREGSKKVFVGLYRMLIKFLFRIGRFET